MTTPLDEKGLLPCPFCGTIPKVNDGLETGHFDYVEISCSHPIADEPDGYDGGSSEATVRAETRAEAIAAWNRRASSPIQADGLEVVAWQSRVKPSGNWVSDPMGYDAEFRAKSGDAGHEWRALTVLAPAQAALAAMQVERDEAKGKLALIVDRIVYSDSYGVPGSDFQCCHLCTAGGAPGIPFEHDSHCPVRQVERDYETWFDDIRATEEALRETEDRAEAAEARIKALEEALRPFVALGDRILSEAPPDADNIVLFTDSDGQVHAIMLDDFRRARSTLQSERTDG